MFKNLEYKKEIESLKHNISKKDNELKEVIEVQKKLIEQLEN